MRKLALLLLILSPLAAIGESIVEVRAQQCVWRAGDDLHWAEPSLDESGWRPSAQLNLQPGEVHAWVRCHQDLSFLRDDEHPAVQITLAAAYKLYVNGQAIGGSGDLRSGREVTIRPGLPLGMSASPEDYEECSFSPEPGETLTFLSDGVVEARNAQGELFGFERTCAISTQSADGIATAAQGYGQEDDITVLTLTFAPAEVLQA